MEWVETPVGMLYITGGVGKIISIYAQTMLMPNAVRVAGIDDAEGETLFDRRGSSLSWVVPVDDTNCFSMVGVILTRR